MVERTPEEAIVERVGRPYVIEAIHMLEAGEGSVAGIDRALEAAGYACGPFGQLDAVGLDADLAIDHALQQASESTGRFDPPRLQQQLVAEGRLGRKSGRGFYRYDLEASPQPDVEVRVRSTLSDEAIVERLELATINEAYRLVEEGLTSPHLVDATMRDLAGHPHGPFERIDELGLRSVIERLRAIHVLTRERSSDQYVVAAALWQMATV